MKILVLDIETSPHHGIFWSLYDKPYSPDKIDSQGFMLSYSAKWVGERGYFTKRYDSGSEFFDTLHELMNKADAIITYNGDKFDLTHINREFLAHGYPPVRPCASIDLYKFVKTTFYLPSYRLDYVAQYFLGDNKAETGGLQLWRDVENGDERAWSKFLRYNKKDVTLTEELYLLFRPWMRNHPYVGPVDESVFRDSEEDYGRCPVCQSPRLTLQRPRRTRCFAIRLVRCGDCGHYFDGKRKKL